jgi:DNA-binding GntR family transcriptional regulator
MSNVGWSKKTWIAKLTPPPQGELARWSTKADFAYEALRQAIVTAVLEPGQQINPKQVAVDLGMSITPVREAMRRLEQDGLVVIRPYVGAEVKELPIDELCENLLIRSQLESLATELSTPLVTDRIFADLKAQIDFQQTCLAEKRFDEFGDLNRRFHMTIYDVIKERRLIKLIEQIWDQVPRAASVFTLVPERAVVAFEEHILIFEALRERDANRASSLVRQHKLGGRDAAATGLRQSETQRALATA